jgi:hypothetical protein
MFDIIVAIQLGRCVGRALWERVVVEISRARLEVKHDGK